MPKEHDDDQLTEEERDALEEQAMEAAFSDDESEDGERQAGIGAEGESDDDQGEGSESGADDEPEPEPEGEPDGATGQQGETDSEHETEPEKKTGDQALREELASLKQQINQITGTVGGLKGYVQKLGKTAQQSAQEQGADAPTPKQVSEAMKDAETYAELKDQFPEWGQAMDDQMGLLRESIINDVSPDKIVESVSQRLQQQFNHQLSSMRSELAVESRHQGWQRTVKSEQFSNWLSEQPEEIQALASSDDPADAIAMLDKYKEQGSAKQRRQQSSQRLERSVAPTDGGGRPAKGKHLSEDEAMELAFQGKI